MTSRGLLSDLELILQKSAVSKESRITKSFLQHRLDLYRSVAIHNQWSRSNSDDMDASVIQDMGVLQVTKVNTGDDPMVPYTCDNIGKVVIPEVVMLAFDRGVFRISYPSRVKQYYPIEIDRFFFLHKDSDRAKFEYFSRVGNTVYLKPYIKEISAMLILLHPLSGFVIQTQDILSGELKYATDYEKAEEYEVVSGDINHNGVHYSTGNTFIAVNADYAGTGKVKFKNRKRRMTIDDPYPLGGDLAIECCVQILTKDFGIERQQIADIINDSKDQLQVMNIQ